MSDADVERQVRQLLAEARDLGLNPDQARAREVVAGLVAQSEEHEVSVEAIKRRNLLGGLWGGGAKPKDTDR
jgi:hypothetical protein